MASELDLSIEIGQGSVDFRSGRKPRATDAFIAVMGVTGSGKSSFIARCSGRSVRIGHELDGCTMTVDVYPYDMTPDRTVYLIDTPGFDDTTKSDAEVLKEIATWLGASYKSKIFLDGIIYLHRITDHRMQGSAMRNVLLFRKLCGPDALRKVSLVTTMWDEIPKTKGIQREKMLTERAEYWGEMVEEGSQFYRHDNSRESAVNIIRQLTREVDPITTALQRELVDEGRQLIETSAGREVQSDLLKLKEALDKKYQETLEDLRAAAREQDSRAQKALQRERERSEKMLEKVEQDIKHLKSNVQTMIEQKDNHVARIEQLERKHGMGHSQTRNEHNHPSAPVERRQSQATSIAPSTSMIAAATTPPITPPETQAGSIFNGAMSFKTVERPATHQIIVIEGENPPTTVAMRGDTVICVVDGHGYNSCESPRLKQDSTGYIRKISFGDEVDGRKSWIALYKDIWMCTDSVYDLYPLLAKDLRRHGIHKLECCFLGPGEKFFAKFKNGQYSTSSTAGIFGEVMKPRNHFMDVSFGLGQSYVMSFTAPGYKSQHYYSLKGYYDELKYFLEKPENKKIIILAVSLDPLNSSDYILVYTFPSAFESWMPKKPVPQIRFHCSDSFYKEQMINLWPKAAHD